MIKFLRYFFFALLLSLSSYTISFATGSKDACLGDPLTLNYSSTNYTSCTSGVFAIDAPPGYAGLASPNTGAGNHTYNPGNAGAVGTGKVFSFTCGGISPDTATLNVYVCSCSGTNSGTACPNTIPTPSDALTSTPAWTNAGAGSASCGTTKCSYYTAAVVNGSCTSSGSTSGTHYTCYTGTGDNQANANGWDTAAQWKWNCVGSGGGTNAACTENKAGCSYAAGASWTVGSNTCYADAVATAVSGGTATANDNTSPTIGSISASCNNGTWTVTSLSCVSYSCSGTAPTGGNLTSRGASTASAEWSYAASGNCTWSCNAYYKQSGNTCIPYACTGAPITNANYFAAPDSTSLSADTAYTYSGVGDTATKCEYNCVGTSARNGSSCVTCSNGGCTNNICNNGSIDAPTCTPVPVMKTLYLSASNISYNTATTIYWTGASNSPTSCTAGGGWSGAKAVGGGNQSTGNITSNKTYTLYCTNAGGDSSTLSTTVNVCPSGTPTWDGSACVNIVGDIIPNSCYIAAGNNSCTMNVEWTSSHTTIPEVRRPYAGGSVFASTANGNVPATFPYQSTPYTLELYNVENLLDSANFSATCLPGVTVGTSWDGSNCVVPSGQITSSSATCSIASDQSTCPVTLTWSTNYPITLPMVKRNNPAGTLFVTNSGTNQTVNVSGAYPSVTYSLWNNTLQLDSVDVTASCIAGVTVGTTWDGSKCVLPSGILTATTPCTVAANESTCDVNLNWSTNYPIGTSAVTNNRDATQLIGNSGTNQAVTVSHTNSNTTYYLYNNDYLVKQVTVTPVCATGTTWNNSICLIDVTIGSLTLDDTTVYENDTTRINWSGVTGGGTITCSIDNGLGAATPFTSGSISTGATTFNRTTDVTYTMSCTNNFGPVATKSVTLNIISGRINSSANSCIIPLLGSLCSVNLTWATTHSTLPLLVDGNLPASTTLSVFANRATAFPVNVAYPGTIFFLNNNTRVLATKKITSSCIEGSAYNLITGRCVATPVLTLTPSHLFISYNKALNIQWSATDAISCNSTTANWIAGPADSGTVTAGGFQSTPQTFSMSCIGYIGSVASSITINVCPAATPVSLDNNSSSCQGIPTAGTSLMPPGQLFTPNGKLRIAGSNYTSCNLYRENVTRNLVTGEYTPTGSTVDLGSVNDGELKPVSLSGNYYTICRITSADGYVFDATSGKVEYRTEPPFPIISLKATPATISKGVSSIISWVVTYPGSVQQPVGNQRTCTLTAKAVCTNNRCSAGQTSEENKANMLITGTTGTNGKTDTTDPGNLTNGPRDISTALNVIPTYIHAYNDPGNDGDTDWKAYGQKTFPLNSSMQFHLNCGLGKNASSTVRVLVTSGYEG